MNFGFSLLPPEILSGLMYTGPGSGPLIQAATAWSGLAEELSTTATSVQSQVSGLGGTWQGGSSGLMAAAVSPYVSWLESTAAQSGQMASQATAAAALFETAHAATVPPPVIAANRALLLALIATNFFGQNTPAIAATEAQYEAMWAQDSSTMESYAASSQTNNQQLPQPTQPPNTSNTANPAAAQGPPSTTPTTPTTPTDPTAPGYNIATIGGIIDTLHSLGLTNLTSASLGNAMLANTSTQSLAMPLSYGAMGMRYLMMLTQFARMGSTGGLAGATAAGAQGGAGTLMTQIGDFVNEKMQGAVGTLVGHFNTATQTISAKLGQAASMGALKVPQAWSMAADGMVRAAPVLPQTVSAPVAPVSATGGMPGGPFGNALMGALAGRGIGSVAAKAPKVIPRSPAGG